MQKRILIVYYTQTGQSLEIIQSLTKPLKTAGNIELVFEAIQPAPDFPFPWSAKSFFQVMPECVQGLACPLAPLKTRADESFDLVILVWQAWFLSPSLPIQAFLRSEHGKALLKSKPVVTVTGCRNMWVMALEDIKTLLAAAGAKHAGNIVLRDKAPNLLSIFSIARWLLYGKKEKQGWIPRAGVSEQDIQRSQDYGESIRVALLQGHLPQLQATLIQQGAVDVLPDIVSLEKNGKRMFWVWSKLILRQGAYGDSKRDFMLRVFEVYLLVALFILSPISFGLFRLLGLLSSKRVKAVVQRYQSTSY